jgi:hypothetical protein
MIFELAIYLIPVIQIVLPLYLVFRIWSSEFQTRGEWGFYFGHAFLTLLTLFLIGRWDIVGYGARYWLYGVYLAALILSYTNVKHLSFTKDDGLFRWSWGALLEIVLFGGAIAWSVAGMGTSQTTVQFEYPLQGSDNYVLQGGGTPIINYHGAFADPQTFALDINKINEWGFRASGLYPDDLKQYEVFGDRINSPVAGKVVKVVDSLADQRPPQTRPEYPAGNHIWIQTDSLYTVLAHLKSGSVTVEAGDTVTAGEQVAKVGNTGNTIEPHLHMHAVTFPNKKAPEPDSLLLGGKPVPITFENHYLTRNNIF